MKLIAYLDIPDKDYEYVQNLWEEGDITALREYVDNQGYFEIEGIEP